MPITLVRVEPRWINVKEGDQDAEFLVRPVGYDAYAKALRALREVSLCGSCVSRPPRTVEEQEEKKACPECDGRQWDAFFDALRPGVLLDWRDVLDGDGQPVPFSLPLALAGLPVRVWGRLISDALREVNEAEARFRGVPATTEVA